MLSRFPVGRAGGFGPIGNLDRLQRLVSAVLAVVLWPLVLLGVDVRID